jgi:DNA-binding phage protein
MRPDQLNDVPGIDPADYAVESRSWGEEATYHLVGHDGRYYAWIDRPADGDVQVYEMPSEEAARTFLAAEQARSLLSSDWGERVASVTAAEPAGSEFLYRAVVRDGADEGIWLATYDATGEEASYALAEFADLGTAAQAFAVRVEQVADHIERNHLTSYADIIAAHLRYRAALAQVDSARVSLGNAIRRHAASIRSQRGISLMAHAVDVSREFLYRVLAKDEWAWKRMSGPGMSVRRTRFVENPVHAKPGTVWTVTAMFAVEAADERAARAVLTGVLEEMDVATTSEVTVVQSGEAVWTVKVEVDLSGLPVIDPDDARTRITYVTRNVGGVTWRSTRTDERHVTYEWPPSFWVMSGGHEVLVHPAIRAAAIHASGHTV